MLDGGAEGQLADGGKFLLKERPPIGCRILLCHLLEGRGCFEVAIAHDASHLAQRAPLIIQIEDAQSLNRAVLLLGTKPLTHGDRAILAIAKEKLRVFDIRLDQIGGGVGAGILVLAAGIFTVAGQEEVVPVEGALGVS